MPETVETSTPAVDTTDTPAAEPELSLSEHEAAYGPPQPGLSETAKAEADQARERIRHRAKSQQGTPEDAKTIQELTKRAREAEKAAGIARNDGESERVYNLRVRAELAEAARVSRTPAPASASAVAPSVAAAPASQPQFAPQSALRPTRPEPSEDEIGTKYAAYSEFTRDQALWVWEQQDQQRQYQAWQQQQAAAQGAYEQRRAQAHATYQQRAATYASLHPEFAPLLQSRGEDTAMLDRVPSVYQAIITLDNGPALLHHLLDRPDQLAEAIEIWGEKPASEASVARATRWLTTRAQAASTGSAAPPPPRLSVPPPPNPVRTGPLKTGDELPGDDSSLEAHERAFGPKRRR